MEKKQMIKKGLIALIIIIIMSFIAFIFLKKDKEEVKKEPTLEGEEKIMSTGDFTMDIVKIINKEAKDNFLISPYNIEMALNMLREGADGNTKKEIDKVLGDRVISNISIPKIVNTANGIFISKQYQENVKDSFTKVMKDKYQSEILYDEFKTPDIINNWVKEKTNNMIEKIIDKVDDNFIMGLVSALAIDVKWQSSFDCNSTISEEFTKIDDSKMNVQMMHQTYKHDAKYIKTNDAEGIVIPYRKEESNNAELEFVALLPSTNIHDYVNSLTNEKLIDIFNSTKDATDKYRIKLSLPRFSYDYSIDDLALPLKSLGIKDAFNPNVANFKKMVDIDAYVGSAIHKTRIELNEYGTKAAAVTYFEIRANGAIKEEDYELIDVKFNKPFVYMIREKNTGEILFFGSVYEPNEWQGSTCTS